MVKQSTVSINLLYLVRGAAIALLILFFLPWIPPTSNFYTMNGASFVLVLLLAFNSGDPLHLRYWVMVAIIGFGFIPIGAVLILIASYTWRFGLSLLCILTGIIGIIPFINVVLSPIDFRKWYLPTTLTPLCLLALIVIGAVWHWKRMYTPDNLS